MSLAEESRTPTLSRSGTTPWSPAPPHEVHLPPEPEPPHLDGPAAAHQGSSTGDPRRPESELVQLADVVGEHGGVGRRARGDGGGVGSGGAVLAEELRDDGLGLAGVVGRRGRGGGGRGRGGGEGGDWVAAASAAAREDGEEGERVRVRVRSWVEWGGRWQGVRL
uniref:Uncharacterized protein n=1 Tax=Arundo donax TaxID=35708 RepID=A0A0A9GCG0_ARUDO